VTEEEASAGRARATFEAVRLHLYDERRALYTTRRLLWWHDFEALWPFAGGWSALGTLLSLGDEDDVLTGQLADARRGLAGYHRQHEHALTGQGPVGFESMVVPPSGPGGDVYYDDNAWVALALLQEHRLRGGDELVVLAQRIFEWIVTGWSEEPRWSHPGGIRWKEPASNRSRNTCSNGPTAEVAAVLYQLTGDRQLLEWAQRIYEWVSTTLRRDDLLYADRIDPDGTIHQDVWSYNQGTMLGAGVLLHQATDEQHYLDDASATADAALTRFTPETLSLQLEAFDAVFLRNLLMLAQVRPDPAYGRLAREYGELMWQEHRDRRGLFAGPGDPLNHSAPMIEVYALAAGAPGHP
jgi:mannose/cellobiose epimerase-like protein (N-acyl-D-glucosamine 2-epimerase family)